MTANVPQVHTEGAIMKNLFALCLTAVLFSACSLNSIDESTIVINDDTTVIDVRTDKEYKAGHLKNALHLPYDTIGKTITAHVSDKDAEIILYCRSGRRSGIAKKTLDAMGYTNVINAGAYEKLKAQEEKN